jgi:hypothetical protein
MTNVYGSGLGGCMDGKDPIARVCTGRSNVAALNVLTKPLELGVACFAMATIYCADCDRKVDSEELYRACAQAPAHRLCGVCNCRVNEYGVEFEALSERAD